MESEITSTKTITTKELAYQLSVDVKTVRENAKKCLPNKVFKNGKQTFWTEKEVTILIEYMKKYNNRTDLTCTTVVQAASTSLTPALKIHQAMIMMQEAYEEELSIIKAKNEEQKQKLIEQQPKVETYDRIADSSGLKSLQEVAGLLGYGTKKYFALLRGLEILYKTNDTNLPKKTYIDAGYFVVKEEPYKRENKDFLYTRVFVTAKGLLWLEKQTPKVA